MATSAFPGSPTRIAFPVDAEAFFQNREAYSHVRAMFNGIHSMRRGRVYMRDFTEDILGHVEAELNLQGDLELAERVRYTSSDLE